MKCSYCGSVDKVDETGKFCDKCGAPLPEKKDDFWKSEPFFYNGYICYTLENRMMDTCEVQFWLGRDLIERISIPRMVLEVNVEPYEDAMWFFWDLFLVAHGEKEVIEYKEKNNKYPASFEVRRIENSDKLLMSTYNLRQLVQVFVK